MQQRASTLRAAVSRASARISLPVASRDRTSASWQPKACSRLTVSLSQCPSHFIASIPGPKGGESPTVDPAALDEPSIPYSEFLEKLNSDQVASVEFLAPNGDAAYATFKSADGAVAGAGGRIRIGEGYPVEDPRGWSSPAFVVKAVARRGVPYKFVVPGLGDSFKEM